MVGLSSSEFGKAMEPELCVGRLLGCGEGREEGAGSLVGCVGGREGGAGRLVGCGG